MEKQIKQGIERDIRKEKLKTLIIQNQSLPIADRKTKYEILIEAGYPVDVAKALCNVLIEDGTERIIDKRGVDVDSAKLVLQELMHDPYTKDDVRLKATEDVLKITGAMKDPENGDSTSKILAGILRDIAEDGRNRSRLYEEKKTLQAN